MLRVGNYLVFLEPGDAYFLTADQYQRFYTEIGAVRATGSHGWWRLDGAQEMKRQERSTCENGERCCRVAPSGDSRPVVVWCWTGSWENWGLRRQSVMFFHVFLHLHVFWSSSLLFHAVSCLSATLLLCFSAHWLLCCLFPCFVGLFLFCWISFIAFSVGLFLVLAVFCCFSMLVMFFYLAAFALSALVLSTFTFVILYIVFAVARNAFASEKR